MFARFITKTSPTVSEMGGSGLSCRDGIGHDAPGGSAAGAVRPAAETRMTSRSLWWLLLKLHKAWVRIVAFAGLALLTAVMAQLLGPLLPEGLHATVGADAVEDILSIVSSSMLVVTTFSLSVAVSAFAAAASSATPRATALLQEDPTTQNVLATFIGAFLFGLLGLIGLKAQLYDDAGGIIPYFATLVVVVLVVAALIRWIDHLMSFGRMADTLSRIERAATRSLKAQLENPWLGGRPRQGAVPTSGVRIGAHTTGYVQRIDTDALQDAAAAAGGQLHLLCLPGDFVIEGAPVLILDGGALPDEDREAACKAVSIGDTRTFSHDPRFGVIVLSEIASRALSPAVNDPGTAIDVLGRLVRVLSLWRTPMAPDPTLPDVVVPTLSGAEMIEDAFRPIARDGASMVEVQIRLQKSLQALQQVAPAAFSEASNRMSAYALDAAEAAGMLPADLAAVRSVLPFAGTDGP